MARHAQGERKTRPVEGTDAQGVRITGVIPVEVDSEVISVASTVPQTLGGKQLEAEETGKESRTRTGVPGRGKKRNLPPIAGANMN